jgi:hypothetical protein
VSVGVVSVVAAAGAVSLVVGVVSVVVGVVSVVVGMVSVVVGVLCVVVGVVCVVVVVPVVVGVVSVVVGVVSVVVGVVSVVVGGGAPGQPPAGAGMMSSRPWWSRCACTAGSAIVTSTYGFDSDPVAWQIVNLSAPPPPGGSAAFPVVADPAASPTAASAARAAVVSKCFMGFSSRCRPQGRRRRRGGRCRLSGHIVRAKQRAGIR